MVATKFGRALRSLWRNFLYGFTVSLLSEISCSLSKRRLIANKYVLALAVGSHHTKSSVQSLCYARSFSKLLEVKCRLRRCVHVLFFIGTHFLPLLSLDYVLLILGRTQSFEYLLLRLDIFEFGLGNEKSFSNF